MLLPQLGRLTKHLPDRLKAFSWRTGGELQPALPLSFPLDLNRLAAATLRWPVQYEWPAAANYVHHLRDALRQWVRLQPASIPQHPGTVVFELDIGGTRHPVAIDYTDKAERVFGEVQRRVHLYFKMQYSCAGYEDDGRYGVAIIPGGYINGNRDVYHYLPYVRPMADEPRKHYDVYGRFGLQMHDVRRRAIDILSAQRQFCYQGGDRTVPYVRSLQEIARSKVVIDLPSNSSFCFRLVDYFAVGACVIAYRHRTRLHVPLEDGKHLVYMRDDLSDLVSLCQYYLAHEDERRRLALNSRTAFDRYLHRDQLAAYYLSECLHRLGRAPAERFRPALVFNAERLDK